MKVVYETGFFIDIKNLFSAPLSLKTSICSEEKAEMKLTKYQFHRSFKTF